MQLHGFLVLSCLAGHVTAAAMRSSHLSVTTEIPDLSRPLGSTDHHPEQTLDHTGHHPDHTDHPPDHTGHHPDHTDHPPDHTGHHPDHTDHPPDHTGHHPDHTDHPPDHTGHHPDHTDHPPDHGDGGHGGHAAWFHVSEHVTILFETWHTMIWEELLGSCIAVAFFAFLYEGFKVLRDWVAAERLNRYSRGCDHYCEHGRSDVELKEAGMNSTDRIDKPVDLSPLDSYHILQSGLHMLQLFFSLCLMLIAMTYNAYLVIALCVGGAVGYFTFSWNKYTVQDRNECCN